MTASRYRALTVEEGRDGKKYYRECGVAFPMKDRDGFSVRLYALPVSGELLLLPPDENRERGGGGGQRDSQRGRPSEDFTNKPINPADDIPF